MIMNGIKDLMKTIKLTNVTINLDFFGRMCYPIVERFLH